MKLPALHFYVGDWRKDIGVQSLSFEERGIWFELLLLMHESDQRGKLTLNGKPMREDTICRLLGLHGEHLKRVLDTLIGSGVARICPETGAIMSKRMVEDEEKRRVSARSGKTGGNPALGVGYNCPGFVYLIQRASDGAIKIGISISPSKRLYKIRYANRNDSFELIGIQQTSDMGKQEKAYHNRFKPFAIDGSGEWFLIPKDSASTLKGEFKSTLNGKPEDEDEDTSTEGDARGNPTLQEVLTYCNMGAGITPECGTAFWNSMEGCGWIDRAQRPVKNWRPILANYAMSWKMNQNKSRNGHEEKPQPELPTIRPPKEFTARYAKP